MGLFNYFNALLSDQLKLFNMAMSVNKTKILAFVGKYSLRSKIVLDVLDTCLISDI